jgi:hypothetical protein
MKKVTLLMISLVLLGAITFAQETENTESDKPIPTIGIGYDILEMLAGSLTGTGLLSLPLDYQQSFGYLGFGVGVTPIVSLLGIGGSSSSQDLPWAVEIKVGPHLYLFNNGTDGPYLKLRGIYGYFSEDFDLDPIFGVEGMIGYNFQPYLQAVQYFYLISPEVGFQAVGGETRLKIGLKFGSAF